jgi:hypothetical protein
VKAECSLFVSKED